MTVYSPRLRVLLDPVYIQAAHLNGSSTYNKYKNITQELINRGHFVYWMVPDVNYVPDELEDHPQVGIIRTAYIQDQFIVDGLVTNEFFNLFNRVSGDYHIDVLCTSRTSLALYYKRLLEPPRFHDNGKAFTDKGYGIPVCIIEEFPQTRKRQHSGKAYWLSQCLGYIAADKTFFLSEHNRSEVVAEMQDYIVRSKVTKWLDTVKIIPSGIGIKELDKLYKKDRWKHEKGFQVLSVGRLFGVSHLHYLPWFDYLFKSGLSDVCLTISLSGTLSGPMRHKLEGIGFDFTNVGRQFKIIEKNPRKNFLKSLSKYHCFIVPVSHLDHPTAIFEAIYMGIPGIIPISDYQQTYFKDYPFVIDPKNNKEFLSTLLWIRDNKKEARKLVLGWRDMVREQYNAPDCIFTMCDEIEGSARATLDRFKTSKGVLDLLRELKGKRYDWIDVVAYLKKSGRMGVSVGDMSMRTTFTYARGAINHSMRLIGYVDDCTTAVEKFVRKDVFNKNSKPSKIRKRNGR